MKRQATDGEKTLVKDTSDKEMLSKIHKTFLKLNKNKRNNSIKNRSKTLTDSSPKTRYRWQISMWKDVLLHKSFGKCKLKQEDPHILFSSVTQSCPTLWDPMNRSTPGLPLHHQLLEFTQTHVHRVSDAIQLSHPLSSPSPPAPNPSQHQSLFQWVNSFAWGGQSTGVSALASFLPKKSQGWSPSEWPGWISLQSKGLSRVFSNTTVQKHQFFGSLLII